MDEEGVFFRAISLDSPSERGTILEQHCGSKGRKRRTLEALLQTHDAMDGATFLRLDRAHDKASGEASDLSLHFLNPSLQTNSLGRLDHYEIVRVVGVGGSSLFLEGLDTKLKRIVAVKVLAPELCQTTGARERFQREAAAAATISSPHVVQVLGGGQQNQTPYLVMEIVSGRTLQQKLDEDGTCSAAEILRIGREAAQGLAAIHDNELLHRDINPENIILSGPEEWVKIAGLGIARGVEEASVTPAGRIIRAPGFMPPELAQGQPVDQRSDLFSLGVVIYAMAAGRSPFDAPSAPAAMRRVCKESPRPLRTVNPDVPTWLEDAVVRLLATHPEDRLQSARELVERFEDRLPTPAALPNRRPVAPGWRGRVRAVLRTMVLVIAVGIILKQLFSVLNSHPMGPVVGMLLGMGTFQVDIDDPNIFVMVDAGSAEMPPPLPMSNLETFPLPPGREYWATIYLDGEQIQRKRFFMERWGYVKFVVHRDELIAELQKADPDRWAARWVLRRGGTVESYWHSDGQYSKPVYSTDQLPASQFFLEAVQLRNLTPAEVAVACSQLTSCSRLQTLRVQDSELNGESLRRLTKLVFLRELDLSHVFEIQGDEFLALAALPELQELSLNYSPHAQEYCRAAGQLPRLRSLAITDCPVRDDMLETLIAHQSLESLKIHSRFLTEAALDPLAEVPLLTRLELHSPLLTDAIWPSLARLERLESLQVGGFPNSKAHFLSESIEMPPLLRELTLAHVVVDDSFLTEVSALTQLAVLRFESSSVDGGALEGLAGLRGLRSLEFVDTLVAEDDLQALRLQLPKCKVSARTGDRVTR